MTFDNVNMSLPEALAGAVHFDFENTRCTLNIVLKAK